MQPNIKKNSSENNQPVDGASVLVSSEETKETDDQIIVFNDIEMQRIEERLDERITDRIANNCALLLMQKPPEADKHFDHPTTIIAPEGTFQWNPEIEQWTCRLSAENFNTAYQELSFLLQRATEITNPEGESAYSLLTLKQLNMLDQALRIHHGDTIIGYTICEEIYLREVNFFIWLFFCRVYEYPPLPETYSKQLLMFMLRPIVSDISASLRISAQTYLLFNYLANTYFEYNNSNNDDVSYFFISNASWILLAMGCAVVLSLILLRGGCVSRALILSVMVRIRIIEQSIIGITSNLTNYGPLILNATFIETCFLPTLLLGALVGYFKKIKNVINIAQFTNAQFLLRTFFEALTVGAFCGFGLRGIVNALVFLYNPYTSEDVYLQDLSVTRYLFFAATMFVSLFRHSYASWQSQRFGLYASNMMNGISTTLLDNYALYLLIVFFLDSLEYKKHVIYRVLYSCLNALSFFSVFLVTFPTTFNLPDYSLEKNPINPTLITKTLRFFNSIPERCLSSPQRKDTAIHAVSRDGIEIPSSILSRISRSMSVSYLYPRAQSRDIQSPILNPMNQFNDSFPEETKTSRRQYAI